MDKTTNSNSVACCHVVVVDVVDYLAASSPPPPPPPPPLGALNVLSVLGSFQGTARRYGAARGTYATAIRSRGHPRPATCGTALRYCGTWFTAEIGLANLHSLKCRALW